MNKIPLLDNENGIIFRYNKIPCHMFNFYILHKKDYKDKTSLWHLCLEVPPAPAGKKSPECVNTQKNYIKLESFRGTKNQAITEFDKIIKEYL